MAAHTYEVVWQWGSVIVGKDWNENGKAGKGSKSPQWYACGYADYQVAVNRDVLSVAVYRLPKDGTRRTEANCVYLAAQSLAEEWRKQQGGILRPLVQPT